MTTPKQYPLSPRHKGQIERLHQQIERAFHLPAESAGIQVAIGQPGLGKTKNNQIQGR